MEYITTLFEPTVIYRIEREMLLRPFQNDIATGLQNRKLRGASYEPDPSLGAYRGVTIHNAWRDLSIEEAMRQLATIETLDLGSVGETEIGGFDGVQIDGVVTGPNLIYEMIPALNCSQSTYCPWLEIGPMQFIVLETTAGTLLITIDAGEDEFDEFLLVAEEILAGISFPDL